LEGGDDLFEKLQSRATAGTGDVPLPLVGGARILLTSSSTHHTRMTPRNILALLLTLVSIGLLIPGLTQPVLTIIASIDLMGVPREIFRQTQSVLQAVRTLHDAGNDFVAGLILFFSITVPFLKALALLIILTLKNPVARYRTYLMVRSLSKWAMADVSAVGVFIALLAAQGWPGVLLLRGVLPGVESGVSVVACSGAGANRRRLTHFPIPRNGNTGTRISRELADPVICA
jgi:paraquat-inducible protein A